ncbi:MAG: TldD/PmbA family protein [Spirochaetes bacterium]|nr:TldD/PmbA family protein [Spirochaetota bacterium]
MKETIKKVLQKNRSFYAQVQIEKRIITFFSLSNSSIEQLESRQVLMGNIYVLKNGQWGFVAFNDMQNLESCLRQAEKQADDISRFARQKRQILTSRPVIQDFRTDFHIDPDHVSLEEKYKLAGNYDSLLKVYKKLQNRKIYYADRKETIYYGNTEGSLVKQDKIFSGILIQAVAKEGNNIQIATESFGGYQGYEALKGLEEKVRKVGKTATDMLKARAIQGGRYTVILDPKLAGVFVHEAFGHLSEADHIFENEKLRKIMKIGKTFGREGLHIIDEGNIPSEAGSIFIDNEGVLPQKTYLIKDGILNSRLHSRETAWKMKEELTGNARSIDPFHIPIVRMTNTYIDKGSYSFQEMVDSVDNGIYAVDFHGGQTNLEMFTFSAGRAFRIEKGKIKEMLKNVVLSGNVFQTLQNIDMIGNDLQLFGGLGGCGKSGQSPLPVSTGSPHIKINNVLIGGV